jgi:hypothetical protein
MSLTDNLAALSAAMDRLFTLVGTVSTGKRKTAGTADQTKLVGGLTPTQLAQQVRKAADDHAALQGNVHNDTSTSVGIHSKAAYDALLPTVMPNGVLPITRYGTQNYLPPGIQGSFEGGTSGLQYTDTAIMIEDDGTAVYLRNGTDGASQGVFYAFLEGATNKVGQPTRTGRRYQPSWFPPGTTAIAVFNSSQSVIVGQLQDSAGVPGDYFVALTNGTYDATKHVGGIIPKAVGDAWIKIGGEVFVAGNTVYFYNITLTLSNMSMPYDITVYTIPRATLAAAGGGEVTFTQMTGITTKGFGGVNYSNLDRMRFCDKMVSQLASDNPMCRQIGTRFTFLQIMYYYSGTPISAMDEATGKIRTRIYHQARLVTTGGAPYSACGFSFVFDPATKSVTLDPHYLSGESTVTDDVPTPTYAGPLFDGNVLDKLATANPYKNNYAYDDFGNVVRYSLTNVVDNLNMWIGKVVNFTTKYAALEGGVANIGSASGVAVRPSFGTAIGSGIHSAVMLSATKLYLCADGVTAAGAWRRGFVRTTLEGGPTYNYASIYRGSIKGYEPSPVRDFLVDLGLNDDEYKAPVNEVTATGSFFTHTQRFIAAKTGVSSVSRLDGRASISEDLVLGAPVSITDTIMQGVGNQIASKLAAAGEPTTTQWTAELVIPASNGVPPFVAYLGVCDNGNNYVTICPVTVTRDGFGNVTAVSVGTPHAPKYVYTNGTAFGLQMTANGVMYCGPCAMYDIGTDVFIGISMAGYMQVPGGSPQPSFCFRYNRSAQAFLHRDDYSHRSYNVYSGGAGRHFLGHPTLGFGFFWNTQGNGGYSDETTKLNFQPIGTTVAEFNAWTGQSASSQETWTCLASQKAAEGWIVYFSEDTPVVINGTYYVLPVSSIDLRTVLADASNRTFYVYVRVLGGVAQYVITTSPVAESNTNLLVGTIATNATQIVSIAAEKVTRLGNFRLSVTSKGSAIPVSTGLPRNADKLAWS